jgi:multidrug efflux pump subunit AcrA (membrane-fusion protein)
MYKTFIISLLAVFVFSACTKTKNNIVTYDLKRSDYSENIDAVGTIQAVNNYTLIAPRTNVTNLIPIVYLADDGAHVKKGDTICICDVPDLRTIAESFSRDLEKMEGELKKLEADNALQLALLNSQVETTKAQLAISSLDSIQMKFAPPVKQKLLELEMKKSTIEKSKLEKKLAAQKRIDNSELAQMRSRIMMQKSRLQVYQTQIEALKLVSPADGIVMHVENYRLDGGSIVFGKIEEGSSTLSGMSVLQIPDMKAMQILVEIPEVDYKRIQNGQKVSIRVDAATNLYTTGKVKNKTLQRKNAQVKSAIKAYEVIISVDSCHNKMTPGLSATCQIMIDQVKDTIVVPTSSIFGVDSSKVVYVADNDKFIPVTVETGLSNSSTSIISKGLSGNETIALTTPPYKLIIKKMKSAEDTVLKTDLAHKDSLMRAGILTN